jgi:hypothetical protein
MSKPLYVVYTAWRVLVTTLHEREPRIGNSEVQVNETAYLRYLGFTSVARQKEWPHKPLILTELVTLTLVKILQNFLSITSKCYGGLGGKCRLRPRDQE